MVAGFLNQRSKFHRLAMLTDATRVHKLDDTVSKGVELVIGSYFDANLFKGTYHSFHTLLRANQD